MIEEKLLHYLFRNKHCPLPDIGTLELVDGNATAWHAEHKMMAPVPFILFSHAHSDPTDLIRYLASEEQIGKGAASDKLEAYCSMIRQLKAGEEFDMPATGTFSVDADGKLGFRQSALPVEFFPEVPLRRVVRNEAVHNMRVGDTETNSQEMAEYFQEQAEIKRDRWWIWAAAIFLVAAAMTGFYYSESARGRGFGNAGKIEVRSETATYRSGQ